jgi:integrase
VLKSVIRYAGESGYSFGNTDNIRFPQREAHAAAPLDAANRTALECMVMDSEDTVCLGILFALFCGLRIGEVCGLRWEDINPSAGTVRVQRTVERVADLDPNAKSRTKLIIGEPKTRSSLREIPLPRFLVEQLARYEQKSGCYLLTNRDTPCEPSVFYGRYKNFMRRQGMGKYNFHALRHTFATRCVEEGFDIKSLSEILGHSNVSTTLGIYVHPTMEQKRAQMERLKPATKAETV